MSLQEIYKLIDELSPEERAQVKEYASNTVMTQANVDAIIALAAEIREGMTEEQLDEMEWAMNVEYIEG
jgi:hypothetical protein